MTPPDANIRKQKRRHWPVIWGIVGAAALAVIGWLAVAGLRGPDPAVTVDPVPDATE